METLYIECKMGAAGDMLMAALYELLTEKQQKEFFKTINGLMSDTITVSAEQASKCGICGTHMQVCINGMEESNHHAPLHSHEDHRHAHHSYSSVLEQIRALHIPSNVAEDATSVYRLIGEAEAKVHGTALEQIHFHEVGSLDALVDVVGCCLLFDMIGVKQILASPVHVGNGTVHCAHGILPVPAPATAELLKGIPFYTGDLDSELCTPTGAAILRHFVTRFVPMPPMTVQQIGIGLGSKDFKAANCVRIFSGETESDEQDCIWDLSCNLDDMTGEDLGYCMELLMEEGALDVFYQAIQMKKNRPGILLHCFCTSEDKERFIRLILMHTTTRGVRYERLSRAKLSSHVEQTKTPYGVVRNKISTGYGITKCKYEYEDLKKIARENQISLAKVREDI